MLSDNENLTLRDIKIENLEIVTRKQKSYFGNFFIIRDLSLKKVYMMKHIGFMEIKGKKAYPYIVKEKDMLEYLRNHQIETHKHLDKNQRNVSASDITIELEEELSIEDSME
jgi:hypothetical protein